MTDFFEKLSKSMSDGMTVNLTIAKKGEKLNVLFTPIPKDKKREDITPFVIKGTGLEIDHAYENTMLVGTAHLAGLESNANEFLKKAGAGTQKSTGMADMFNKEQPKEAEKSPVQTEPPKDEPAEPQQEVKQPAQEEPVQLAQPAQAAAPVSVGEKVNVANAEQVQQQAAQPESTQPEPQPEQQAEPAQPQVVQEGQQGTIQSEPPKPSDAW